MAATASISVDTTLSATSTEPCECCQDNCYCVACFYAIYHCNTDTWEYGAGAGGPGTPDMIGPYHDPDNPWNGVCGGCNCSGGGGWVEAPDGTKWFPVELCDEESQTLAFETFIIIDNQSCNDPCSEGVAPDAPALPTIAPDPDFITFLHGCPPPCGDFVPPPDP